MNMVTKPELITYCANQEELDHAVKAGADRLILDHPAISLCSWIQPRPFDNFESRGDAFRDLVDALPGALGFWLVPLYELLHLHGGRLELGLVLLAATVVTVATRQYPARHAPRGRRDTVARCGARGCAATLGLSG